MLIAGTIFFSVISISYCVSAYQTAYDKADNQIIPGNVSTKIVEVFPSPTPITPDANTEIDKKIYVTNAALGSTDFSKACYIRLSLGYSNSDIGKAISLKNMDKDNWIYCDDGFYYYKKILQEGESTTPLCSGFTIDASKLDSSEIKIINNFEIQVYQEAIEADVSDNFKDAWSYYAEV